LRAAIAKKAGILHEQQAATGFFGGHGPDPARIK